MNSSATSERSAGVHERTDFLTNAKSHALFLDPLTLGVVFGSFLALWHALWSALVALRFAQPVIDFVLWIHFMSLPVRIEKFESARALVLIGITFLVGFVGGWIFALVWNAFHSSAKAKP